MTTLFLVTLSHLVSKNIGTSFDESEESLFLSLHNSYRSSVASGSISNNPGSSDMNELFWDSTLETVASNYAELCTYEHNENRVTNVNSLSSFLSFTFDSSYGIGENIFIRSFSYSTDTLSDVIEDGMQYMFDEYLYYDFENNDCENDKVCGHYLQMVTSRTRYVGCGYHMCDDIIGASDNYDIIVVCNYYPAKVSSAPYTSTNNDNDDDSNIDGCQSDNQCDSDRYCDTNTQLCSGCMAPSYNYCTDRSSDCYKFEGRYCSLYGCENNWDSTNVLCAWCRDTCNVCTDDDLKPPCECDAYPNNIENYSSCVETLSQINTTNST